MAHTPLTLRRFTMLVVAVTMAGSVEAQSRQTWERAADIESGASGKITGSVTDLDAARLRFGIITDREAGGDRIGVVTDAVSTAYYGFGRSSEVFRGSAGFTQLHTGDRVEAQGLGAAGPALNATDIILLGRSVATQTTTAAPAVTIAPAGSVEGTVRQLGSRGDSVVIETASREMLTVTGTTNTPVYYQGSTYRIGNVEVGDRIRIDPESRSGATLRARSITVLQSVSPTPSRRTLTSIAGRISRIDDRVQTFRMQTAQGEVRVDARFAYDERGNRLKIADLRSGDTVEVSGEFDSANTFRADTVRFARGNVVIPPPRPPVEESEPPEPDENEETPAQLRTIVIYGTVDADLRSGDVLRVRDSNANRTLEISVVDDFIVRLKNGSYVTADQLKEGDRVAIQAFQVGTDRYVAQTIRTR